MINHPKFIYLHIPRTGGTFISKFLEEYVKNTIRTKKRHISLDKLGKINNKFVFSSIRNPYNWYVSWWKYNQHKPNDKHGIYKKCMVMIEDMILIRLSSSYLTTTSIVDGGYHPQWYLKKM